MADVAREAGVSKNAVSLALRNSPQIPDATRARIRAAAERLGYRRNPVVGELLSRLRRDAAAPHRATLGLVNMHRDRDALRTHPTLPAYLAGCEKRAEELGYNLDHFWIHHRQVRGRRLLQILRTRNIRGLLLVGLMAENRLPEHFRPVAEAFPCMVTGVRTVGPTLSFVAADHHRLVLTAFERALALGYRRPGLVLDPAIDALVEGRFTAGFRTGQAALPPRDRAPPFYGSGDAGEVRKRFHAWRERHRPDVVFTLYNDVRRWLAEAGWRVPRDIGLVQLEWRAAEPEWTGMNQHNEITGETAVDRLVSQIHHGERGPPPHPTGTLVEATWLPGTTTEPQKGPTNH